MINIVMAAAAQITLPAVPAAGRSALLFVPDHFSYDCQNDQDQHKDHNNGSPIVRYPNSHPLRLSFFRLARAN